MYLCIWVKYSLDALNSSSTFIHFHPFISFCSTVEPPPYFAISTISTISSLLCHLVPGELPVVGVEVRVELHVLSTLVVATVVAQPDVVALQI